MKELHQVHYVRNAWLWICHLAWATFPLPVWQLHWYCYRKIQILRLGGEIQWQNTEHEGEKDHWSLIKIKILTILSLIELSQVKNLCLTPYLQSVSWHHDGYLQNKAYATLNHGKKNLYMLNSQANTTPQNREQTYIWRIHLKKMLRKFFFQPAHHLGRDIFTVLCCNKLIR